MIGVPQLGGDEQVLALKRSRLERFLNASPTAASLR
jgi:hypothetical protein